MKKSKINAYLSHVDRIEELAANRRMYHVGGRFIVEVTGIIPNLSSPYDMVNVWKKHGYIPAVLPSWLCVRTYYYDHRGNCWGRYNITEKSSEDGKRRVVDFRYLREATEENERELVAECIRLMLEGEAEAA